MTRLLLPPAIRTAVVEELEYEPGDTVKGVAFRLDADPTPDYIVQSAPSLCGNGGCEYLVVDGKTGRTTGRIFGSTLYVLKEEARGHPLIGAYGSLSANQATYTRWSYDGRTYQRLGSRSISGSARDTLLTQLRHIPPWKPRQSP